MLQRPSSRLLIVDRYQRLLLFRFELKKGALAGQVFWATPGGGVDKGESFEDAARRELHEEVGVSVDQVGHQIARRRARFASPSGEMVDADERYFLIFTDAPIISEVHWTALEREVMTAHRWWSQAELKCAEDQIWPEDLTAMLIDAGAWTIAK